MAAEEKRTITIKINGSEVAASVKLIEKELAKARLELNRSTIGSKEYNAAMKRISELQPILNKHRADVRAVGTELNTTAKSAGGLRGMLSSVFAGAGGGGQAGGLGGLTGGLKGLIGMAGPIGLLTGGVTALVGGISSGITTMREFESALTALRIRTGITREGVAELKDGAIELAKAYGEAPSAILKAFGEAASARPELVGNTEALKSFTEQALMLSKITGGELNTTIADLTTIMNTNGIVTSDTEKVVNMLVGASQKGAKEVPFLAEAMQKIGGAAASANVGLAEQAATLELLGEKYTSSAETAGTNVRNILIELQEQWKKNNDGPFNFREALEQLKPSMNDITELTDIFGKENAVAAQTLLQNTERLDELTVGINGFTGASDLATESQKTMDGQLAILGAKWDSLWASITDEGGVLTSIVSGFNEVTSAIGRAYDAHVEAFRNIFDSEDLAAEKLKAQADRIEAAGKAAALENVQRQGLEKAREEAALYEKNAAALDQSTQAYRDQANWARLLREQIALREKEEAEAAKKKQAAIELDKQNQTSTVNRGNSAADKAREDARKKEVDHAEVMALYSKDALDKMREEMKLLKDKTDELNKQRQDAVGVGQGADSIAPIGPRTGAELANLIPVKTNEDAVNLVKLKSHKELEDMKTEWTRKAEEARKQAQIQNLKELAGKTTELYDMLSGDILALVSVGAQNRTKKEMAALEEQKKQGLITEQQYQMQKETIERKAFERKKRIDIVTAFMDGLVAVGKAFAQSGTLGFATAAPIAAQTLIRIAALQAQKFALGGMVDGPSHAQGGVPIEAEGGEYVIRRSSVTPRTLPVLKMINELGAAPMINWGRRASTLKFATGGSVPSTDGGGMRGFDVGVMEDMFVRLADRLVQTENNKRVVLVKDDVDTFDKRVSRVQKLAKP